MENTITLEDALQGISSKSYFRFCGLNYSGLKYHGFDSATWPQLSPAMQLGIKRIICRLWELQSIVFYYEFDYIVEILKSSGVKLKQFFRDAGLNDSFYSNKYFTADNYGESMIAIRLQIIRLTNQLFQFIIA